MNTIADNTAKIQSEQEEILVMNKGIMMQEELNHKLNKLMEQKAMLQKSHERYKLIVEGSSDGLWDWDLTNDMVYMSKKWSELLGFEEQEINEYYKRWRQIIHPADTKRVTANLKRCFKEKKQLYICEYRVKLKDSKYIWISSKGKVLYNDKGDPVRIAGSHTDIAEKKRLQKKLEYAAYYDQLTGTIIRSAFINKLKLSIEEANKKGLKLSVLFLDVDDFKTVNDIYGHHIGDLFLKKIAARIKSCIRNIDTLCRTGGDEFAILMPNLSNTNKVDEITKKIIDSFKRPLIINKSKLFSSISIGIAIYPDSGLDGKVLLERADIAMYKAKEEGKNSFRYFNNYMIEEIAIRNNVRGDLKDAIDNGELFLCYQPLIDVRTKRVMRMEALIRWKHLENGIISPDYFIPVAEETKLIIPIGEWVLKNALKQFKNWKKLGFEDFRISVNVSMIQLQKPDFAEVLSNILFEGGISPENIELEITESILLDSVYNVSNNINILRKLGVKIAIDDFGIGYNSLKYIQKFYVDCIKIDRTFVSDINIDISKIIINHIISLGHSINAEIVAEGVETKEQYEYLKEQGCDLIQGYYFSKPLSPEEATEFLRENKELSR